MVNAKMATIGTIMEYANPDTGVPARYVVISKVGQWVDEMFTLRSIDPDSGYAYANLSESDLSDANWTMVSA